MLLLLTGCAKYNIFYNAKKAFDDAEHMRQEAMKKNEDPPPPTGAQRTNYDTAIEKSQTVLDEYPGHSLTDDALFLQAKSWHRLESYRMSIRKLDLLFQNYPATPYLEEGLYLQGLNYLLIGAVPRSQEYLDRLVRKYPESPYRAEVLKVTGDNAYALESWQEAADAYRGYLDQDAELRERDRIGLKLAECYWELEDYRSAAGVLQEVSRSAESRDLRFRALLLQARVVVQLEDFEVAELLLGELRAEAEIYDSQGDVRLIEAESLFAQGRGDEATPLLESMPPEWENPIVKARSNDLLGHQYLARGLWLESRKAFRGALGKKKELDEPELTQHLHDNLNIFLAAERAMADAKDGEVARNTLLKANALRFGFDRPAIAARLYARAAADSSAEPTVAARALYGAFLAFRDGLDNPDSAAIFAEILERDYPDSPQAYEARGEEGSNLLGYLLDQRRADQVATYAAMSDEERRGLEGELTSDDVEGSSAPGVRRGSGLRRRMVYLQRRDHLVFAPTEIELARAAGRQQQRAQSTAAADTSGVGGAPLPADPTGAFGTGTGVEAASDRAGDRSPERVVDEKETVETAVEENREEEEEEEEEQRGFDLRSPRPHPDPRG